MFRSIYENKNLILFHEENSIAIRHAQSHG
jgi:hypothetical protein